MSSRFICKILSSGKDVSVVDVNYYIVEYILGYFMGYNTTWLDVDHVFFPIFVAKEKHWILAKLTFKERCLFLYDSIKSLKHDKIDFENMEAYSILLLIFLELLDFWSSWQDNDFNAGIFSSKKSTDPLDVILVNDLPLQENK